MNASIVVNSHQGTNIDYLRETLQTLDAQTYDDYEIVVVVSDAPDIADTLTSEYGDRDSYTIDQMDVDEGLAVARNRGAQLATGDVVVFTDDDIIAARDWLEQLMRVYEEHDASAVGGAAQPHWPSEEFSATYTPTDSSGVEPPGVLPPEFYWLVGVTHRGFGNESTDTVQPVRNTFGCNISFRRDVFIDLGGFPESMGKQDGVNLQGEETALCARLTAHYGQQLLYNPRAVVAHRVDAYQTTSQYLLDRSFWQGYSKAYLSQEIPGSTATEYGFLTHLLKTALPESFTTAIRTRTTQPLFHIVMSLMLTAAVGFGYLYGKFVHNR